MKKILIVLMVLTLLFALFLVGCDELKGSGIKYVDPCEREFESCNHGCGEGWLSGLCKEKCSSDYRKCMKG